jgi:hypothetical protein
MTYYFMNLYNFIIVEFFYICIYFKESIDSEINTQNIIIGSVSILSIGYLMYCFSKINWEHCYFKKIDQPNSIDEILVALKSKTNGYYSYLVEYAVIYQDSSYLIYWKIFSLVNFFSFLDSNLQFKYLTETQALDAFIGELSHKRLNDFVNHRISQKEIRLSSRELRIKLLAYCDFRMMISSLSFFE